MDTQIIVFAVFFLGRQRMISLHFFVRWTLICTMLVFGLHETVTDLMLLLDPH